MPRWRKSEPIWRSTNKKPPGIRHDSTAFSVREATNTRGVTLPVKYLGEIKDPWGNIKAGFELAVTIDRKDFGITWNTTLDTGGLILGDAVEISISLEVAKQ